jgi:transposase-like protein
MLTVLIAYFERNTTVVEVCKYFSIAVSTLYIWKERLLEHKELLLGELMSRKKPALAFIHTLLGSDCISDHLSDFFHRHDFSFMQDRLTVATRSVPP